jgi:hypothetical protein
MHFLTLESYRIKRGGESNQNTLAIEMQRHQRLLTGALFNAFLDHTTA